MKTIIKPTAIDFLNLQRVGILDKKEGYLMGLWARSEYDNTKFLELYSQFRELKEVEDLLEDSRFGDDYNDYDYTIDKNGLAHLKYDENNKPIKKKAAKK